MEKMISWPNQPEEAHFKTGEDMWQHYNRGQYYNPFEGLHLAMNEKIQNKIERKVFDRSDKYNDLIQKCRNFMMRVRIQDLFHGHCNEIVHEDIEQQFEEIKKHNPSIPDLDDVWCGTTELEMEIIIPKYIQLLDPYTMAWLNPDDTEYNIKEAKYLFHRDPPTREFDTFFLYNQEVGEFDAVAEAVTESINNNIPWQLQEILCENEEYL